MRHRVQVVIEAGEGIFAIPLNREEGIDNWKDEQELGAALRRLATDVENGCSFKLAADTLALWRGLAE